MNVLVVGGGAREHVMCSVIMRSGDTRLYCVMKNRNPGIVHLADGFLIGSEMDVDRVVAYASEVKADIVFIGPEAPLEAGLADALISADIPVCAPTAAAARIETDKEWMRSLCVKYDVSGRLECGCFVSVEAARSFIESLDGRVAIKPIGLTGGKGVWVEGDHFHGIDGALDYVGRVIDEQIGGQARVLIEEKAVGEEFTIMAFSDGKCVSFFPAVQDHKRLLPGDKGPNTGGMGSYSCSDGLLPFLTAEEYEEGVLILNQLVRALDEEGCRYVGPIYGQFMATADGVRIIEVNARFGDPENMNVLSLLRSDFVTLGVSALEGSLDGDIIDCEHKATVLKYVVPEGYGVKSISDTLVTVDEDAIEAEGALIYYASVDERDGAIYTTSSRSLAVVGISGTLDEAEAVCERALSHVKGDHIFIRHDIGTHDLVQRRVDHMEELRRVM